MIHVVVDVDDDDDKGDYAGGDDRDNGDLFIFLTYYLSTHLPTYVSSRFEANCLPRGSTYSDNTCLSASNKLSLLRTIQFMIHSITTV